MFNILREEHPELPEIYIRREYYKLTNRDYTNETGSSTLWLHQRGVKQCCMCRAWDKVDDRFKMCPVCLTEKEERAKANFLKFKKKQGLELELGY